MRTATADPAEGGGAVPVPASGVGPERSGRVRRAARTLATPVPAASFVAFRIAFGLLASLGAVRFLAKGWVDRFYLEPDVHLTFPRFGFVAPLPGPWMHLYVAALAVLGLAIAAGVRYRSASAVFAIGFAYVELIDAALYLNHYWFVTIAAVLLAVLPPPDGGTVPRVSVYALRAQLAVVYVFAGVAKLNPDWLLAAQPMRIWLGARTDRPVVGAWLDEPAVAHVASWFGAVFDLTIVGWLLWRRSRPWAYAAVVVFHVATAALFQIGLFPWVMIALTPVFFAPDWPSRVRHRLLAGPGGVLPARRGASPPTEVHPRACRRRSATHRVPPATWIALAALCLVNVVLPLRHWAADGNVRFNDDGYYLSWRVMSTERTGFVEFTALDPTTGQSWQRRPEDLLAEWQAAQVARRPDLVLAAAHLVADELAAAGYPDVEVRADSWVSFNGRPRQRWIDPTIDLAAVARTSPAAEYVLPHDPPVTR